MMMLVSDVFALLSAFVLSVLAGGVLALLVFAPKRTISTPPEPRQAEDPGADDPEGTTAAMAAVHGATRA